MALLKEDGSLNIEWINSLPSDKYINLIWEMSDDQYEEYKLNCPNIKEQANIRFVNCTMEEDMRNNGYVKAEEAFNMLKKKYGIK